MERREVAKKKRERRDSGFIEKDCRMVEKFFRRITEGKMSWKRSIHADPWKKLLAYTLYDTFICLRSKDKELRLLTLLWLASPSQDNRYLTSEYILRFLEIPRDYLERYVFKTYGYDLKEIRKEVSVLVKRYKNLGFLFAYLRDKALKRWRKKEYGKKGEILNSSEIEELYG